MKVWQIVSLCLAIAIVRTQVTQVIPNLQTQVANAITGGAAAVSVVKYSNAGDYLAAAVDSTLYVFTRNAATGRWENPNPVSLPGKITALDFSPNGNTLTALTTSANNIVFLTKNNLNGQYAINQSVPTGTVQPKTVSYVGLGETPVIGYTNGTIQTYKMNSTGLWNVNQTLSSGFTSVAASDASNIRYIVCDGGATGKVRVYYWNYTTGTLEGDLAADTITTGSGVACTALTLSNDDRRIAVGHSDGTVGRIFMSGSNNTYANAPVGAVITAANTGVAGVAITNLVYNNLGNFLVTCNANGIAYIHNLNVAESGVTSTADTSVAPDAALACNSLAYNDVVNQFAVGNTGTTGTIQLASLVVACPTSTGYAADLPTTDDMCTCVDNYFWFNGGCRQIDCNTLNDKSPTITTRTLATTAAGCLCKSGYVWTSTTYQCTRQCSTTVNAAINNTNFEVDSCYCNAGYTWDQTNSVCGTYINCSAIAGTTGVNVNAATCGCASGYYFNATANTCYRNCTGISGAAISPTSNTQCICTGSGLVFTESFNSTTGLVGACGINCSSISDTTTQTAATTCTCQNGFTWDATNQKCQVDCHTLAYSVGCITGTTNRCKCASRTRWDPLLRRCIANYNWTNPAAIAVPIAVPLGVLGLLGLLASILCCLPSCGPVVPMMTPVMVPTAVSAAPVVTQAAPVISTVQRVVQPVQQIVQQPVQQIVQPVKQFVQQPVQRVLPQVNSYVSPTTSTALNPMALQGLIAGNRL